MTNIFVVNLKTLRISKHFSYRYTITSYILISKQRKEKQGIPLRCGNSKCGKTFNWEYHTRNILRLERCADKFPYKRWKKLQTAKPSDYDKPAENAAVNNSKYIELPDSKVVCRWVLLQHTTSLIQLYSTMNEETFKDAFNVKHLLTSVRSLMPLMVKVDILPEGYKDVLDALYYIIQTRLNILLLTQLRFRVTGK